MAERQGPQVGEIAPDFALKDQDGGEVKLSDFCPHGQVAQLPDIDEITGVLRGP